MKINGIFGLDTTKEPALLVLRRKVAERKAKAAKGRKAAKKPKKGKP